MTVSVGLEAGEMWSFAAPIYHRDTKAKLRIVLAYGKKTVYSGVVDS
jgi:hypothetical protein